MIRRIGTWGGRAAVINPQKTARQVLALGLTDLSLCVESQWNAANGTAFDPFVPPAKLAAALTLIQRAAADAGRPVSTHVLVYPQATRAWANAAVDYLQRLDDAHRIASVEDDGEENWSKRTQVEREEAARIYRRGLDDRAFRRGVTGIVYADFDKLEPLTRDADYYTWQGYATTIGRVPPGRAQKLAWDRWRHVDPDVSRHVAGLAAYGQEGAGDLPAAEAMAVSWDAAEAIGVTEVRYWSLAALVGPIARFVAQKCAAVRSGGAT